MQPQVAKISLQTAHETVVCQYVMSRIIFVEHKVMVSSGVRDTGYYLVVK